MLMRKLCYLKLYFLFVSNSYRDFLPFSLFFSFFDNSLFSFHSTNLLIWNIWTWHFYKYKVIKIFLFYLNYIFYRSSGQDGGVDRYTSHNQKKGNNQFKNKKQPELPENQTVWKSNNQGVKEETFIQIARRDRDGSREREGVR